MKNLNRKTVSDQSEKTKMLSSAAVFPVTGKAFYIAGYGYLRYWGLGSPAFTETDAAPGAIWQDLLTGELFANVTDGRTSPYWTYMVGS